MPKYNITSEMMHKQLRFKGTIARKVVPYYKPSTFHAFNKLFKHIKIKKEKNICGINVRNVYINRGSDGPSAKLRLCIFSPAASGKYDKNDTKMPAVVWFHGGGFGQGVPEAEFPFIKTLMNVHSCVFIVPEYRLSVDAKYPAAVDDCYASLMYVKNSAEELRININQIFVGGDSAGGGLACAVAILARDRGEVNIAFQMPLYPMLDDRMLTESSKHNDAPMWNTKSNECAWELYLGDLYQTDNLSCYAAPGRLDDFSGLPPAATYIGTIDPFYDETVNYFKRLSDEGIEIKIKCFEGCFHGFECFGSSTKPAKEAKKYIDDVFEYAVKNYFKEN